MYSHFSFAFINAMGSPMELIVIAFAILLMFGAKALPNALRTFGRWMEQLRQVSREVQREIMEVEDPLREARRTWEKDVKDLTVGTRSRLPHAMEEADTPKKTEAPSDAPETQPDASTPPAPEDTDGDR